MSALKDLTGVKIDKLTAISRTSEKSKNGDYLWKFVCDCGGTRIMSLGNFQSKPKQSCLECSRQRVSEQRRVHGFKQSHKTYKAWCKIRERCYNKNDISYRTYGAMGITMHEDFKSDFMKFYAEIGEAPEKSAEWSVDRIDFTKGYEPGNIRWANHAQQARNKGMMNNNTSGVTGVSWENKVHPNGVNSTTYAVVQWKEYDSIENKINCKRCFSVKKFGLLESFAMACAFRESKIKELNSLGYGYSDNHGR